jgi:Cu/Ag efflux protein CusF
MKPVLSLLVAAALNAVLPLPKLHAQATSGGPGIDDVEVVTVTAVVDNIDLEKRKVTLTLDNGKTRTYKVNKVAQNLDQVQPGDHVKITATEELMVAVNKSGENPAAATIGEVGVAPRGSKPGAVMVETTAVSGKILAINNEKRKVTLLDADGKKKIVRVKNGLNLSQLAVGDSVDAVLTESVVISVTK